VTTFLITLSQFQQHFTYIYTRNDKRALRHNLCEGMTKWNEANAKEFATLAACYVTGRTKQNPITDLSKSLRQRKC